MNFYIDEDITSERNREGTNYQCIPTFRHSHPEVFLVKGVLKIYRKFAGGHPYRSVISIKFQNHTSAWVFSCKFAAYFQNTFY